jgi:hypothetical protein
MNNLPKPEPIGTAPCPITGCAQVLAVFKYRERGTRGSPFKGKFYARCPQHGRVIEAIVPASQEHVVAKGNIWAPDQIPSPAQPSREPIQAPAQPALHVIAPPDPVPAQPTQEPAQPTHAPTRSAPTWLQGWNLWDWWPT